MTKNRTRLDDDTLSFMQDHRRKSARRVILSTKALFNTLDVVKTTISTTATKINTPEKTTEFFIICKDAGGFYIGDENVATTSGYPMAQNEVFDCASFKKKDNNEIYGITASGSVTVYAVGSIKA